MLNPHDHAARGRAPAAFTLMEMLVIISIIMLLLSITAPSLSKSKENARRLQCMTNSRSQIQACDSYSVNNKDYFPPSNGMLQENWTYSFDIRASADPAPKRPKGIGLTLAQRFFNHEPKALHCPSLDTTAAAPTNYHSMDVTIPNWWNSVGASWWNDPVYANYRITIGYTYRAPSWFNSSTGNRPKYIRVGPMPPKFVVNGDIMDPRFGVRYHHRDGYNFTRMDESTAWKPDPGLTIEAMATAGAPVDGRFQAGVEDAIWRRFEEGP
jgi:type II secretory pathway pseudopilin PulG